MMKKSYVLFLPGVAVCVVTASIAAQQTPAKASLPKAAPAKTAVAPTYKAIATVQDLMATVVDPASKSVFAAVSSEDSPNGRIEKAPKNDAEWSAIRHNALMMAEVANLLLVPGRHFAVPENAQKHAEGELPPAEIEVRVSKDRPAWNKLAAAFRDAALGAVKAAEEKRKDDFNEVNEAIDTACENCHLRYWYPDQVNLFKNAPKPK